MSSASAERSESVAAVVLNWNDVTRTRRAVESLLRHETYPNISVVLVDNGSCGDDAAVLTTLFARDPVSVVALDENVGFARAVNVGTIVALRSGADFILLFNNDAFIDSGSDTIRASIAALQADPALGAVGPIICNDDARRSIQSGTYALSMWFPIPRANRLAVTDSSLRRTAFLSGSCLMLRARAFAAVGGLDPDFFLYGDDVDLARRLLAAGYHERLLPVRGVAHTRAASNRVGSARYAYTVLRSNLILIRKHARWYHLPSAITSCAAASLALAAIGLRAGYRDAPYAIFRAWRDFLLERWGGYVGSRLAPVLRPSLSDIPKQRT